jgi:hypothetical protein
MPSGVAKGIGPQKLPTYAASSCGGHRLRSDPDVERGRKGPMAGENEHLGRQRDTYIPGFGA